MPQGNPDKKIGAHDEQRGDQQSYCSLRLLFAPEMNAYGNDVSPLVEAGSEKEDKAPRRQQNARARVAEQGRTEHQDDEDALGGKCIDHAESEAGGDSAGAWIGWGRASSHEAAYYARKLAVLEKKMPG